MDQPGFPYFSRSSIKNLYAGTDFGIRKKWGQNFLTDPNHIEKIVSLLRYRELPVIEIGPGLGALTWSLLNKNYKVFSAEIDPFLSDVLRQTFSANADFTLWEGDALKILDVPGETLSGMIGSESCIFAGNLPYYITTDLLVMMSGKKIWKEGVFLVQKEYAVRITEPGAESSISVFLKNLAEWKYSHEVPPAVFYPQPSVDSAVIYAERRPEPLCDPAVLEKLLRFSYRGKRKKIFNSWRMGDCGIWSPEQLRSAAESLGLSAEKRPEEWQPEDYYALAGSLMLPSQS